MHLVTIGGIAVYMRQRGGTISDAVNDVSSQSGSDRLVATEVKRHACTHGACMARRGEMRLVYAYVDIHAHVIDEHSLHQRRLLCLS